MRYRGEVMDHHKVQGDKSCVAWAVEFIVKLNRNDFDLNSYSIQESHLSGLGFGAETIALLDSYDIAAEQTTYDWDEFEAVSKADAALNLPLIFTYPSSLDLNLMSLEFEGGTRHAAIRLHLLTATAANLSLWLRRASACLGTLFARLLALLASQPALRPLSV